MGLQILEASDFNLMEGEVIHAALDLKDGLKQGPVSGGEVLFLTNRRLALSAGGDRNKRGAFASVLDIEMVDVSVDRRGVGAYVWAALAMLVGALLWRAIDHPVGSVAAALTLVLMGAYLIVDRFSMHGRSRVTFKLRGSELRCEMKGGPANADLDAFVSRVFEVKHAGLTQLQLGDRPPGQPGRIPDRRPTWPTIV